MTEEEFVERFDKAYMKEFDGIEFWIGETLQDVAVVNAYNLLGCDDWRKFFWINGIWDSQATGLRNYYFNFRDDYVDEDDAVENWVDIKLEEHNFSNLAPLLRDSELILDAEKGVQECLEYLAETYIRPLVSDAFDSYDSISDEE